MNENEGPAVLRVGIIEGSLAVEVVVGFMTADNTAIGKLNNSRIVIQSVYHVISGSLYSW